MKFLLCILINSVSSEGNALLLFPHTPLSRPPTSYPVLPCLTQLRKFQPHPRFRSFWRCIALRWTGTVRHSEHPSYTHTDKQESTQGLLSSACLYLQGSVRDLFDHHFISHFWSILVIVRTEKMQRYMTWILFSTKHDQTLCLQMRLSSLFARMSQCRMTNRRLHKLFPFFS